MKWEYLVEPVFLEGDGRMAQEMLNERGAEGWEMVAIVPNSVGKDHTYTAAIFKRPLNSN